MPTEVPRLMAQPWLVLTQYYAPEMGAPQIRLRAVVAELERRGIRVSVLTAMPNYPTGRVFDGYRGKVYMRETIDGIPVERLWVWAGTGASTLVRLANYCSFAVSAMTALFRPRLPKVVFVESQPLPLGLTALLMKWLRGVRYIYNVPDLQVDAARDLGYFRSPLIVKTATAVENLLLRQAWKVSTVTHAFTRMFQDRGVPADRITFLPNGADTHLFRPMPPCEDVLDGWNLRGKKIFVYTGTMAYYHGLHTLVEAAEILQQSRPDVAIVMAGNGPERPRIEALVAEKRLQNIQFRAISYEEAPRVYSVACGALAVLRNMPVAQHMRLSKVYGPMACGVPVIYSGTGESADLLQGHDCGLVVPPETPEALARAMADLAADPELRNRLGTNALRLVQEEYSWSSIVERWLDELADPETSVSRRIEQERRAATAV